MKNTKTMHIDLIQPLYISNNQECLTGTSRNFESIDITVDECEKMGDKDMLAST